MTGLELIIPTIVSGISSAASAAGSTLAAGASAAGAAAAANPFAAISAASGLVGSGLTAVGQIQAGQAADRNARYQAAQLEAKANEEQAAAYQKANEHKDRMELALSRHRALAAASGFLADDPSNLDITEDIASYGTLQSMMDIYGGKSRSAGLEAEAVGARVAGAAAKKGSYLNAGGTILGGIGGAMSKYANMTKLKTTSSSYGSSG